MKKEFKTFVCFLAALRFFFSLAQAEEQLFIGDNNMSVAKTFDICNFDAIYNPDYSYSLPRPALEEMLAGKAFGHTPAYTPTQVENLKNDIRDIYAAALSGNAVRGPMAVITAGAPGAGKTTVMREDLQKELAAGKKFAYIDPDDVCLKSQTRTYLADIEKSPQAGKEAYNEWRSGSNAANHLVLANLIREKFAFYFGTTSTGPVTFKFFDFLKKQGYQIRLIYVAAPDDVRWKSIQERDKTFIQTTEKDTREKGDLLPQRINDTFLAYADVIEFHYRDAVDQKAAHTATWVRHTDARDSRGTLCIVDSAKYKQIKDIHNAVVARLQRPDLKWEEAVEKRSVTPAEEKMARMQAYTAYLKDAPANVLETIEEYIEGPKS